MELRPMRSVSLALILMTLGTVCDAKQNGKPSWYSESSEHKATLFYGIYGTGDVGFHVSCNRDSGSIELIPSLKEVGLKAGEAAKVGLSTKADRVEFEGNVFQNEETGENNILIKVDSVRALGDLFLHAGLLTITLPNDRYTLPIGPQAIASFASFKKYCSPSDPAPASQK
jgi:hypothetical protein